MRPLLLPETRFGVHGSGWIWVLGGFLILFAACGQPEDPKAPPSGPQETAQAPSPTTAPPKPGGPRRTQVSQKTRETYRWYCAQCHGLKGKGDGINAKFLTVPPRDHTKSDYLETRSDQQLFQAIQSGGLSVGRAPCMPRWGHTLDDERIWALVDYIRELCQCEAL